MTSPTRSQLILPLFDVFVFIDWFGTLSTARFWEDITDNRKHPLSAPLRTSLEVLFTKNREFVRAWMRGSVSEEEVIESLKLRLPRTYRDDYLCRALLRTCRNAAIDPEMAKLTRALRRHAFVAVASDNMDCFVKATPAVLSGVVQVDELIVSSEVGALKAEDPDSFFGPVLERYSLDRRNAILIDDSIETCERFIEWGGYAIHYTDVDTLRDRLTSHWPGRQALLPHEPKLLRDE